MVSVQEFEGRVMIRGQAGLGYRCRELWAGSGCRSHRAGLVFRELWAGLIPHKLIQSIKGLLHSIEHRDLSTLLPAILVLLSTFFMQLKMYQYSAVSEP